MCYPKWNCSHIVFSVLFLLLNLVISVPVIAGIYENSTECPYASHFNLFYPISNAATDRESVRQICNYSNQPLPKGKFCILFRNESNSNLLVRTRDFRAYLPKGHFLSLVHTPIPNAKRLDTLNFIIFNGEQKMEEVIVKNWTGIRCYNDFNNSESVSCSEIR